MRYRTALNRGFGMLQQRPLSTTIAVEVCRTIKGVELDIRNTPGTVLMNDTTGTVIYGILPMIRCVAVSFRPG
ncbi:hypothetical protein [Paracoccus onubensis]|uniref:hypothetical protein n=1 Tax=Paracoccus onubensis TaxID=1675788 RepID=UPI001E2B576F|nr:hypothetical protein [Paracoccus onubensis]